MSHLLIIFLVLVLIPLLLFFIIIVVAIKFAFKQKENSKNSQELLILAQEINNSLVSFEKRLNSLEDIIQPK